MTRNVPELVSNNTCCTSWKGDDKWICFFLRHGSPFYFLDDITGSLPKRRSYSHIEFCNVCQKFITQAKFLGVVWMRPVVIFY